jgi:alpha-mannosidase
MPASQQNAKSGSLLRVQPDSVLAITLKPSDEGKAWIVRLFNATAEVQAATLNWPNSMVGETWQSNLSEDQLGAAPSGVTLQPWELRTLRVDRI